MRLVYVLLSPTYGMHAYTADYANRAAAAGHSVELVTTRSYPAGLYDPAVSVHPLAAFSNTGLSAESLSLWRWLPLKERIVSLRPELVHFTGPHLWNMLLLLALARAGLPVLHTIHDLAHHPGARGGRLLQLWNRRILETADHILVHGRRFRRRLLAQGLPAEQVSALPLLHLFGRVEGQPPPSPASLPPLALYFGRLAPYKGIETLLAAFELSAGRSRLNGLGPRLLIAGAGRPPAGALSQPIRGVEWRARPIPDVEAAELFGRCSLVVLPYLQASQSALIATAYYFAKPVIVTDAGALAECVQAGETGWIVPAGDAAALADALDEALADPARLRQMGAAGQAWYHQQRPAEQRALFQLYERLAGRAGTGRVP
ncbi:MAG: glycosyltransferase [Candidatus Promineifilaceae bacterium]